MGSPNNSNRSEIELIGQIILEKTDSFTMCGRTTGGQSKLLINPFESLYLVRRVEIFTSKLNRRIMQWKTHTTMELESEFEPNDYPI